MEDTVVFKGTLYWRYEYEILNAAPADAHLIGTFMTIEDPVKTSVFQWPLDRYDALVDRSDRITVQHTIGDPRSYRTRGEKNSALRRNRGFEGDPVPVPRGTGATACGLELTQSNSTAESRTLGIGAEFEFKHSNVTVGGSFAIDKTRVHEITMEQSTAFEGTVGAIADSDYGANNYDFGLLVLQKGTNTDGSTRNGKTPYWLVTHWVD